MEGNYVWGIYGKFHKTQNAGTFKVIEYPC